MRPISSLELPPTNAAAHFVLAAGPGAQPASAPARLPLRSPGSPSAGHRPCPATGRPERLADINNRALCTSSGVSRPPLSCMHWWRNPEGSGYAQRPPDGLRLFKHGPPSLDLSKSDPVALKTNRQRYSSSGMPLRSTTECGCHLRYPPQGCRCALREKTKRGYRLDAREIPAVEPQQGRFAGTWSQKLSIKKHGHCDAEFSGPNDVPIN